MEKQKKEANKEKDTKPRKRFSIEVEEETKENETTTTKVTPKLECNKLNKANKTVTEIKAVDEETVLDTKATPYHPKDRDSKGNEKDVSNHSQFSEVSSLSFISGKSEGEGKDKDEKIAIIKKRGARYSIREVTSSTF